MYCTRSQVALNPSIRFQSDILTTNGGKARASMEGFHLSSSEHKDTASSWRCIVTIRISSPLPNNDITIPVVWSDKVHRYTYRLCHLKQTTVSFRRMVCAYITRVYIVHDIIKTAIAGPPTPCGVLVYIHSKQRSSRLPIHLYRRWSCQLQATTFPSFL